MCSILFSTQKYRKTLQNLEMYGDSLITGFVSKCLIFGVLNAHNTAVRLFVSPKTSITTITTGVELFVLPKTSITTKATSVGCFISPMTSIATLATGVRLLVLPRTKAVSSIHVHGEAGSLIHVRGEVYPI